MARPAKTKTSLKASKPVESAKDVFGEPVTVNRTVVHKDLKSAPTDETIDVVKFVGETARVSVTRQVTKNLGNFEGAKIAVTITAPCYLEEVEDTYKQVAELTDKYLSEEVKSISESESDDESEDEEEEDEEEDSDEEEESEEDEEEEDEESEDDEEEMTVADAIEKVKTMKADELAEFVEEQEIEVDLDEHKSVKDKREAVIAVLKEMDESEDEEEDSDEEEEDDDESEDEEEEDEDEDEEDGPETYTKAELNKMDLDELKEVFASRGIKKLPRGSSDIAVKKKMIAVILAAQDQDS